MDFCHIRFVYVPLRTVSNLSIYTYILKLVQLHLGEFKWISTRLPDDLWTCRRDVIISVFFSLFLLWFFPVGFEMQFWNKWWWSQNRFYVEHTLTHTETNYYTTVHYRCDYVLWDYLLVEIYRFESVWVCFSIFKHIQIHILCAQLKMQRGQNECFIILTWLHSCWMVCTLW